MSATPAFASTPKQYSVIINTAETNRLSPSAGITTLLTGTTAGISVPSFSIKATQTTSAGLIMFFLNDGSLNYLFHEEAVTAVTPAAGTPAFEATFVPDLPIVVPTGWTLRVATLEANSFVVATQSAAEL